jgi:hypothetical protein
LEGAVKREPQVKRRYVAVSKNQGERKKKKGKKEKRYRQ